MWDLIDGVCSGMTTGELGRAIKVKNQQVTDALREVANRVPGHKHHNARERLIFWRAKQIGVAEYFAGLRDRDGFPIVERDLPPEHPDSHAHAALYPEV